jgi:multiple sugar transport system substrate-binding protein
MKKKKYFICIRFFLIIIILIFFSCIKKDKIKINKDVFKWDVFSGTKIKLLCNKHPWSTFLLSKLPEFKKLSGIDVEVIVYPEDQFRKKLTVEMMSNISDIDLFMTQPEQDMEKYTRENWLEPLDEYLNSKEMYWPMYDLNDHFEVSLNVGKKYEKQYTIPIQLETSLLAYNKEIFNKYDIKVPLTMDDLEEAAKKIFNKSGGKIYGITLRGRKGAATSQWVDFLHSFGGEWLDKNGKASINTPEAISATDFYGKLLRLYGPKTATSNSWYESISIFMQGEAGMIYDANVFKSNYENPETSKVAGKVGYEIIPEGAYGSIPHVAAWSLAIYSNSKNKGASWYFIQWATSKEMAIKALAAGIPSARNSAWNNSTENSEWTKASIKSYNEATSFWNPQVIEVSECREAMGVAIVDSILGKNVKEACNKAAEKINSIIKISEK